MTIKIGMDLRDKMTFKDVAGQAHAKRALEVALAGGHTITITGSHESQKDSLDMLGKQLALALGAERFRSYAFSPCPCGYHGHETRECTCSRKEITEWRVAHKCWTNTDITVRLHQLRPDTIVGWAKSGYQHDEDHASIMARIKAARAIVDEERAVEQGVWDLMRGAIAELHLTPAQVRATMDVANTIAALSATDTVQTCHLAEAIQYRG